MKAQHLCSDFALQSYEGAPLSIAAVHRHSGGYTLLVESQRYPQAGHVQIEGLVPDRYYLLDGAAHRFARTDSVGVAAAELRLTAASLLTVAPLI